MALTRGKNKAHDNILPRKKTTIPPEVFETEAKIRNKEMLKLLGISNNPESFSAVVGGYLKAILLRIIRK